MHKWCHQLLPRLRVWDGWEAVAKAPRDIPTKPTTPLQPLPPSPNTQQLRGRAVAVSSRCLSRELMSPALVPPLFQFNLKLLGRSVG